MAEQLTLRHTFKGHGGWVTAVATTPETPDLLLSASRDKKLLIWDVTPQSSKYGLPKVALTGHSNFVQEIAISSDGHFALSASWDHTLRLWDLKARKTTRRFRGHTNDVLSVSFSADNRQIVSGSRDRRIKLWNTLGECKFNVDDAHSEWVSCVRFSPSANTPVIVSAGWDKLVKVWDLARCKLRTIHRGHKGYINAITISPDGSLCASGGKDGTPMLWDLNDAKHLYSLEETNEEIHALCFSPNRYWLCAATTSGIKVWDLQTKVLVTEAIVDDIEVDADKPATSKAAVPPTPISLAWSPDGQTLYAGYKDNHIRVWDLSSGGHF